MPISLSAKKSLRSSIAKRKGNLVWKKKYREAIRAFAKLSGEKELSKLYGVIDKMVKKHIFHKNKAARLKSQFSKKMKKTEGKVKTAKKIAKKTVK